MEVREQVRDGELNRDSAPISLSPVLALICFIVAAILFVLAALDIPKTLALGLMFVALGLVAERWHG